MTVHDVVAALPDVKALQSRCRRLAALDLLVCDDSNLRTFTYNDGWRQGAELAEMSNHEGDEYSIVFGTHSVLIRGFDHESPLSPVGLNTLPVLQIADEFYQYVGDERFGLDGKFEATVCIWKTKTGTAYEHGYVGSRENMLQAFPGNPDPDGANELFKFLTMFDPVAGYVELARHVYDKELSPNDLNLVFSLGAS